MRHSFGVPVPISDAARFQREMVATYEFDSDLLIVQEICAFENDTKRSLSDLLSNPVMNTDDV